MKTINQLCATIYGFSIVSIAMSLLYFISYGNHLMFFVPNERDLCIVRAVDYYIRTNNWNEYNWNAIFRRSK